MNTDLKVKGEPQNYTPEEAALLVRLRVLVAMRWIAILGVLASTLVASLLFHIGFPTIPVYIICLFLIIYNLIFFVQAQNLKKNPPGHITKKALEYSYLHIMLDLLTLTVLIHFTGGIENPFIFYFVFHAIAASISLNQRSTYALATLALALVLLLVGMEYAGWIQHYNLQGFFDPTLYRKISYVLPVLVALSSVLYGATYMTTAISGELKRRQRQVMQLDAELLEKKTAEISREKEMQEKLSRAYQELSQSHQQLKESQEQLIQAEKLTSLGQLAASIAHEVNNPLSGVLIYTQLLAKKMKGDGVSREIALEYLSKMEAELNRSTKLIRNLLDFARQSPPAFRQININEVVNRAFDLAAHTAKMQKVLVIKELESSLPDVTADFDQLQQVCTNLILNAIQAMPEGGKLTIRTSVDKNYLKIVVQDTGYGISPDNMRKLFTPFFTTKQEVKGVGLGLAISYGIIQRHYGRIDVQSKEKEGTTFTVYLPLKFEELK
ncbi:MAG: ATP-binding protein [Dehalococcoidales bacterium]|nr:ATP-binding protein [Dehalococcoidales bacterium]